MTKLATFAAGCFWGVESAFMQVEGVIKTSVGFMGGHSDNPSYKDVCYTETGHAEVCQVEYDPEVVSYERLLEVFWHIHDPTQLNRQGPDVGTQYRSAIFAHDKEQLAKALSSKEALAASGRFGKPIVTQIVMEDEYYLAEDYHQQYHLKNGLPSCHLPPPPAKT